MSQPGATILSQQSEIRCYLGTLQLHDAILTRRRQKQSSDVFLIYPVFTPLSPDDSQRTCAAHDSWQLQLLSGHTWTHLNRMAKNFHQATV